MRIPPHILEQVAGHSALDAQTLQSLNVDALVLHIVQTCASIQHERSVARHGYDKYEDANAILDFFGVSS